MKYLQNMKKLSESTCLHWPQNCAIVANADFIVTQDCHFDILNEIPFPKVHIKRLQDFCNELHQLNISQ